MIRWLKRRVELLVDDLVERFDPDACRDCDEGYVTVYDPWRGVDRIDICRTCDGTGKRGHQ